jgi:hypothetical protein
VSASLYEARARRHWETFLPDATAKLDDPEEHFRALGARVEGLVTELAEQLATRETPKGATEQEKVATREWAYRTAEEVVLQDEVYLPAEPDAADNELPPMPMPTAAGATSTE